MFTAPERDQHGRVEPLGFDVTLCRQRGPLFVPILAIAGAIQMAGDIGVDLDLATFSLDHDGMIAQ